MMQVDTERNLIHPEDRIHTETVVRKAKTKRNTYVKAWRHCKKIERRQSMFVQEYIDEKYRGIYDEAINFYNMLNGLHPTKNDLRKTKEFKKWKKSKPTNLESSTATTTTATISQDNPESSTATTTTATTSQDNPESSTATTTTATTSQDNPESSTATTSQDPAQVTVEVLPPLQITDQRITEILQDLRNDPDLDAIFNEIEIPADEDDVFW